MTNVGNRIKAEKLGMPFGTANGRLRKILLFDLVKKLGLDICYRCSSKIETIEEFSIEHKQSWLFSAEPVKMFFDIDNIAYSHLICNTKEGIRLGAKGVSPKNKKLVPEGTAWCTLGQHYRPVEAFSRNRAKWNGLMDSCSPCRKIYRNN